MCYIFLKSVHIKTSVAVYNPEDVIFKTKIYMFPHTVVQNFSVYMAVIM